MLAIREIGSSAEQVEKERSHIQRARSTKEDGGTIRLMVSVCTLTVMELDTRASGIRTCSTAKVPRVGLTIQSLLESISKAERTVLASTSGLTAPATKGNGKTTK